MHYYLNGHDWSFVFNADRPPNGWSLLLWASIPQAAGEIWCLPAGEVVSRCWAGA